MGDRLADKTVLLTGAAGGIGRALVRGMLDEGASVSAVDVNADGLAELAATVRGPAAERLRTAVVDIADYAACASEVEATLARFGGLHALVNNAGLGQAAIRRDHFVAPISIEEISPEMWQRFLGVNLTGPWNLTRAVVPHFRRRRHGRIVDVTTSFFTMLRGWFHPYGPSKAGLEAMAAGHAAEFEGTGITVNVVVPGGPTDTPMVPPESGLDRAALIAPTVMVAPIVWLCSDASCATTGRRFVAAHWDTRLTDADAAAGCSAPIAWPDLAQSPVWPGGRPAR